MRRLWHNNGLSIALLLLFAVSLVGHSVAGVREYNEIQREHSQREVSYFEYLGSGAFIESVFENWESEFLQMAVYVWLTSFLYQKGSAESKDPDEISDEDEDPGKHQNDPDAPGPVRAGGMSLQLYKHSLTWALLALFLISFILHLYGSTRENCREQLMHGEACSSALEQLRSATFWFESFQNWQSEFLSIAVVVLLSIFLRHKGSPESKPVHAPHSSTGR